MVKTKIPLENKTNVVYELKCSDFPAVCMSQMDRYIGSRVPEQSRDCRLGKPTSVMANHRLEFSHTFDFDEPKIILKPMKIR